MTHTFRLYQIIPPLSTDVLSCITWSSTISNQCEDSDHVYLTSGNSFCCLSLRFNKEFTLVGRRVVSLKNRAIIWATVCGDSCRLWKTAAHKCLEELCDQSSEKLGSGVCSRAPQCCWWGQGEHCFTLTLAILRGWGLNLWSSSHMLL